MPLGIVFVPGTFGQMPAAVVAPAEPIEPIEPVDGDPDPAGGVLDSLPDPAVGALAMPPAMALFVGAACPVASATEVTATTSSAAVATDARPTHHKRVAGRALRQPVVTSFLTSTMTTPLLRDSLGSHHRFTRSGPG